MWAHGCMGTPNQRGTASGEGPYHQGKCTERVVHSGALTDTKAHFPAGPRRGVRGEGVRYQMWRAGRWGWTPYEPLNPRFRWRSGVCGDVVGPREPHRKGGKFFDDGRVVASYVQGSIVKVGIRINAHHNGFMELHLCDATKCGGDINFNCFRSGHCTQLKRAHHPLCDGGYHRFCGPIDRRYPGRWYLPCSAHPPNTPLVDNYGVGGRGFIHYKLPKHFVSQHAVLQWFWTGANECNPPGVREYFEGADGPKGWGRCSGQAGAIGGYVRHARTCGDRLFPEEYLQCADIKVVKKGRRIRSPFPWSGFVGRQQRQQSMRAQVNPNANGISQQRRRRRR